MNIPVAVPTIIFSAFFACSPGFCQTEEARFATSQSSLCRVSTQPPYSGCKLSCATDQDLPNQIIHKDYHFQLVNGRYQFPSGMNDKNWFTRMNPEGFYFFPTYYNHLGRPVLWREIDPDIGLAVCSAEGINHGFEIGRLFHKADRLKDAADEYERIVEQLKQKKSSDTASAVNLARLYEMGWGRPKSLEKAVEFNLLALSRRPQINKDETGNVSFVWPAHPRGQHNLASMYFWGRGVEKNTERAAELWESAAGLHQVHSVANLAWLYRRGLGVNRDREHSAKLYLEAIRRLSLREDYPDLLVLNTDRYGVSLIQNPPKKWLKIAADSGQREAILTLGYLHYEGAAGERDLETALDYFESGIKLFGLSPEYSPGPAFVASPEDTLNPAKPAWLIDQALLELSEAQADPFAQTFFGIRIERSASQHENNDDERKENLTNARKLYADSSLPNTRARAGKLLLVEILTSEMHDEAEFMEKVSKARELLQHPSENGNPSAEFDLSMIERALGNDSSALDLLTSSYERVITDFFHPDARPLLSYAATLRAQSGPWAKADAMDIFARAGKRARFNGDSALLEATKKSEELAGIEYGEAKDLYLQQREAAEFALGASILFLWFLGAGWGSSDGGAGEYGFMDMRDPIQLDGALMMNGL